MAYKQQTFIAHSPGGWEVQSQAEANSLSGNGPLPSSYMAIFSLSSHGRKGMGSPWSLLLMALMSLIRHHNHDLIVSQGPHPPPHTSTLGVRV